MLLLAWLPKSSGQGASDRLSQIVVTNIGPPAASDELIRANIHVKVGDPYVRASIDDDVRNLYTTGFFHNIEVNEKRTDSGIILTYILEGKLKLTAIKYEGNTKYDDRKLLKKVSSKIGEPVDERKLFTDTQEIQKMYEKAGYPHTVVKYELRNINENAGTASVAFIIQEGSKIKIVEVDFIGAHAFTQKKLRKVVKTRKHWMFSWLTRSGVFKDEQFEDDKDRLADFYREQGYIDFEIRDIKIMNPTPKTMRIEFYVTEGNLYKVGSVNFTNTPGGNMLFSADEISRGLKTQHGRSGKKTKIGEHGLEADTGMVFTPKKLTDDTEALEDFYGAKGYIDVKQNGPNLRVIKVPNTESGTMDLEYQIDSGEKSYIEKIEIKGNVKTKDKVIRRELAVSPGEVFDMVRVKLSKDRLEGLQFFDKVDTRAEATDVPGHKNLIVGVDEKPTGALTFGAGFNTVESLVGFAEVSQSNFDLFKPPYFTGGGQKFRLKIQLGTELQDYEVSFVEPWFLNRKLALSVDLYHSVFNYQSLDSLYDESRTGMRLGLTRALGSEFLIGGINYTIEDVGIINVNTNSPDTILRESGYSLISKIGASLAYDTRNNATLPNGGQRTEVSAYVAGGPLGGDQNYYKLQLKSSWFFKGFAPGHVLELSGRIGVAKAFDGSQDVPFYDRFYLGGQYDLRGFDYRGVGPRETFQNGGGFEPVGGDTSWLGSAEYSIPIIERLRFATFFDIGNVSARPYSFKSFNVIGKAPAPGSVVTSPLINFQPFDAGSTGSFSDNYGFGLRLYLPISPAPLRLDYGIPIRHDPFNSGSGKFQFGIGFTRPL